MVEWVVTFWDVGQGDATDICLPDNSHVLIDAGPIAGRQNPFPLWFKDVASGTRPRIRTLILTHTHLDHFLLKFAMFQRNLILRIGGCVIHEKH